MARCLAATELRRKAGAHSVRRSQEDIQVSPITIKHTCCARCVLYRVTITIKHARTCGDSRRSHRMNGHPRTDMGGHSPQPCALKFMQIARASCSYYHLCMLSACWTPSHVHMLLATDTARSVLTSGALHQSTCCPRVSTMRQTTEAQPCAVAYRAYNPDSKTPSLVALRL